MNFAQDNPNIYWKRVTIPKGLPAILESLAKEAMRENPEDLIPFLSKVVDDLIAKRDQEELIQKGGGNSGGASNTQSAVGAGGGDSKVSKSKVDSKSKRKLDEENPLLEKETTKPQYTTEIDEDSAASKIQAGFRGYKTRKLLKEASETPQGGGLPLTSLTPLPSEQSEDALAETPPQDEKQDKVEVTVDDDAIAAEIKPPLETIREESLDGSLRIKTPEVAELATFEKAHIIESPLLSTEVTNETILEEEGEVQEDGENEPEESPKVSSPEVPEKESADEPVGEEASETLVVSKDLSYEELTGDSLGSNKSTDKDDPLSEVIGEIEIETLVEDTESKADDEVAEEKVALEENKANDDEQLVPSVLELAPEDLVSEDSPQVSSEAVEADRQVDSSPDKQENKSDDDAIVIEAEEKAPETEKVNDEGLVVSISPSEGPESLNDIASPVPVELQEDSVSPAALENDSTIAATNEQEIAPETDNAVEEKQVTSTPEFNEIVELETPKNDTQSEVEEPTQAETTMSPQPEDTSSPVPDPPTTTPTVENESPEIKPKESVEKDSGEGEEKVEESKDIPKGDTESPSNIPESTETQESIDKPDLSITIPVSNLLTESESFANTDSVSSSTTTTVRVLADKTGDSSQDASSLPESDGPPVPKPRSPKPSQSPLPEMEPSKRQRIEPQETNEIADESAEVVAELPAAPVTRRQRSSQKSRAGSSKYRSGFVMDDEVSMEEMEAQIENEMLSQAATKIQAGFRGYKTRKSFRQSGVSRDAAGEKVAAQPEHCFVPQTTPAADNTTTADNTAETNNTSQQLPVTVASAFSQEESFQPRRAHEGSCPPEITTSSSKAKPSLAFLRSRSYPGSTEGDALVEGDEVPTAPQPDMEYDPDYINNAATVIQATIRGYLVRKRSKLNRRNKREVVNRSDSGEYEDEANPNEFVGLIINPADRDSLSPVSDSHSDKAAVKIQAAFRGYKDRQKVRKTKKAVVTIQATVRGFLARRRIAKSMRRRSMQRRRSSAKLMSQEIQRMQKVNDAATKIQAVYRGYQVRSKIGKNTSDE